MRKTAIAATLTLAVALAGAAATVAARTWTEEDFEQKSYLHRPLYVVMSTDPGQANSVVGEVLFHRAEPGDTFLDLARYYGLGANEMHEANPGINEWTPWLDDNGRAVERDVILPTQWVMPDVEPRGLVVNIPEMRIYYFHATKKIEYGVPLSTFPVGLGRDEWKTPRGSFKVRGKTENPTWVLPASIRAERIKEKGWSESSIPPGPDNPLGKHRFELTMGAYAIHGTNIPWGVGMQVSHGCVRLYPEDVARLFPMVPVGTQGQFIYQPVKIGARGGKIYAEVHKDIYNYTPGLYREAVEVLNRRGWSQEVDYARLQRAIEEQSGIPMIVSREHSNDDLEEEIIRLPSRRRNRAASSAAGGGRRYD
jgi:L,D-transpeptidase ErfK/SrfK